MRTEWMKAVISQRCIHWTLIWYQKTVQQAGMINWWVSHKLQHPPIRDLISLFIDGHDKTYVSENNMKALPPFCLCINLLTWFPCCPNVSVRSLKAQFPSRKNQPTFSASTLKDLHSHQLGLAASVMLGHTNSLSCKLRQQQQQQKFRFITVQ